MAEQAPTQVMQGIAVPASSVDPAAFFRATRRLTFPQKTIGAFQGLGSSDYVPILQTGIISGLHLRLSGSVVTLKGTGAIATTSRWPYDMVKAVRVSANGQSNLINCSGWDLKVRDIMARGDLSDRGVAQGIGGASPGTSRSHGSLALANESWGLGQNVTAIADGTYNFDLALFVPIAFDQLNLMGAVFAQTSATDLNMVLDWAPQSELFVTSGTAAVTVTCSVVVESIVFSIPQGPNGDVIVPDLSVFHSLIKSRQPNPSLGLNEIRLAGQGIGRQLMRIFWRTFNGATPVPLPLNATNYGQVGWRYGSNDTPEVYTDGQQLGYSNERVFNSPIGLFQGYGCLDFASEFAFRDSVDEGAASELRLLLEIPSGVSLTSPFVEYVQETAFAGAAGA